MNCTTLESITKQLKPQQSQIDTSQMNLDAYFDFIIKESCILVHSNFMENYYEIKNIINVDKNTFKQTLDIIEDNIIISDIRKSVFTNIVELIQKNTDNCNTPDDIEKYAESIHKFLDITFSAEKDIMLKNTICKYIPSKDNILKNIGNFPLKKIKSSHFPFFLLFLTLLTCTDYRKSDGEEITVTAYLYNKEGIEKVITALKPLKSKRPFSEIVKIIQKMLAPNTACQDDLDCIAVCVLLSLIYI